MGIGHTLPNLKDKPFGGVWSIRGGEQIEFINNTTLDEVKVTEFLDKVEKWKIIT